MRFKCWPALIVFALLATVVYAQGICVLIASSSPSSPLAPNDEFVGPFASWTNVKTTCGAAGDGVTDDTTSIQNCITNDSVIFFPAGTYLISSSLSITKGGLRLIGANPSTTAIKWNGTSGGSMVTITQTGGTNGNDYWRLTFNGNNTAANIVNSTYEKNATYIDDVFENATNAGYTSTGNTSEFYFLRDTFENLTNFGFTVSNANAYNYHIHQCTFFHDGVAINSARAFFTVYDSVFVSDTTGDISAQTDNNPYAFDNNVSVSSGGYFIANVGAPNQVIVRRNRVINPGSSTPVSGGLGGYVLFDNQIQSTSAGLSASGNAGALMIGNQFTSATSNSGFGGGRVLEINDTTGISASSISSACPLSATTVVAGQLPTCYSAAPNNNRQCYAGGAAQTCGTSAADEGTVGNIQSDITAACSASASGGGTRPVVHIKAGSYSLSTGLSIPASCDVQLIGDGFFGSPMTTLVAPSGQPVITFHSPSKAIVETMHLQGNGAQGVVIHSEDATSARVQIHFPYTTGTPDVTTLGNLNGLTNIALNCDACLIAVTGPGFTVTGNGSASAAAHIGIWGGALGDGIGSSSSDGPIASVTSQGLFIIEGIYTEIGSSTPLMWNLTSSNSGVLNALGIQWKGNSSGAVTYVSSNAFPGILAQAGNYYSNAGSHNGQIAVTGTTNYFEEAATFWDSAPYTPTTFSSTVGQAGNVDVYGTWSALATGGTVSNASVLTDFAPTRCSGTGAQCFVSSQDTNTGTGVTDVQLFRLQLTNMTTAVDVESAG